MSTPDFLPQDDSNFNPIRFYTAQDVYYYTIDNRPLQDLEQNLKAVRTGGGDASRRAAAMLGLNLGALYSELIATNDRTIATTGLGVVKTGNNSVRITPGAYYEMKSVSQSVADSIMKQALLTKTVEFSMPSPATGGTSLVYTVEGQFVELSQAEAASSQLPYVDPANKFSPSTYIHGELRLSIVNGISASTGTQTAAATSAGKFPLYNITLTQGQSNYKVELHPNAPRGRLFTKAVPFTALPSAAATSTTLNDMTVLSMAATGTQGVVVSTALNKGEINPYLPIKLKITFSPEIVGGNAILQFRYKAFAFGESTGVSPVNAGTETVSVVTVADGIQTYTMALTVPTHEFAGFVAGKWDLNKDHLKIIVERIGSSGSDTNAGSIRILSTTLTQ